MVTWVRGLVLALADGRFFPADVQVLAVTVAPSPPLCLFVSLSRCGCSRHAKQLWWPGYHFERLCVKGGSQAERAIICCSPSLPSIRPPCPPLFSPALSPLVGADEAAIFVSSGSRSSSSAHLVQVQNHGSSQWLNLSPLQLFLISSRVFVPGGSSKVREPPKVGDLAAFVDLHIKFLLEIIQRRKADGGGAEGSI